ncbi:MAG TPA: MASE1 domain-containing protein, partial [Casimicrobiaceae bacterium]
MRQLLPTVPKGGVQTAEVLPRVRRALEVLLVAVVYFLAAKLSLLLAIPPGYATPVWPPSGIALAAALLFGTRIWPGIWVGAVLINATIEGSPLLAGAIATGNTLEAVAAATLVRPYLGRYWRFQRGEDVVRFVVSCALCAGIAASVGIAALASANALDWRAMVANAWTWWQGDASGMIIVTPVL